MTKLLQRLHEQLVLRQYSPITIRSYVRIVENFPRQTRGRLDRLGPDAMRRYHLSLIQEGRVSIETVARMSARSGSSVGTSCDGATCTKTCRTRSAAIGCRWS